MQDGVSCNCVLKFLLRVSSKAGSAHVSALVTSGLSCAFVNEVLDDIRQIEPPLPLGTGVVRFVNSVIWQEVAASHSGDH